MTVDDFGQAVEIIHNLFYFVCVKRQDSVRYSHIAQQNICFSIDDELMYEPFFADFGPLNLGKTYRFCQKANQLLQEAQHHGKRLYFFAGPHAHHKANAAVLVGIFQVIYLNRTADEAYKPLVAYKPYVPFRDASCGVSTFHLTVLDCMKGIQKARDVGFIDWNSGSSTWSLEEYEHYEQVENGDLNWIVPNKFVAFSGPAARGNEIAGYRLCTPEDYWDYFRRRNVTTIVRLNKKVYERKRFLDGGFKHHDMYFPDGSCPSDAIIQRFLDLVENEPGCIAVHCKAGLGRTGVLICSYIMKHYRFTAEEVIGYIRICRPGSVIGPQQNFMREIEAKLWQEGEMYRAARGMPKAGPPAAAGLVVAGRAAGQGELAVAGELTLHHNPNNSKQQQPNGYSNGHANGYSNGAGSLSYNYGGGSLASYHVPAGASRGSQQRSSHGDIGTYSSAAPYGNGDMSLLQYGRGQHSNGTASPYGNGHSALASYASGSAGASASYYSHAAQGAVPGSAPTSGAGHLAANGGHHGGFRARAGYSSSAVIAGPVAGPGRSMTPLRYGQAGSSAAAANGAAGLLGGVSASHPGPLSSAAGSSRGSLGGGSSASRSTPGGLAGAGGGGGRSPSANRLAAAPTGAAALRATLHTDTLAAADRQKTLPERSTQSADITRGGGAGAGLWKLTVPPSPPASGPTTPSSGRTSSAASSPTSPGGAVARILAPNGQPRKVPVALLSQYQAAGGGAGGAVSPGGPLGAGPAPLQRQGSSGSLIAVGASSGGGVGRAGSFRR